MEQKYHFYRMIKPVKNAAIKGIAKNLALDSKKVSLTIENISIGLCDGLPTAVHTYFL